MRKTKEQKAITLIALILTIVVLLILAVVAISSIQNDSILSYAENAAKDYNQAVKNEQDTLQGYLNFLQNGGVNNPTDLDLVLLKRYLLGVSDRDNSLIEADLELLKKYFLGENKSGRIVNDVFDFENMLFINEENTIPDASTALIYFAKGPNEDSTQYNIYFEYNNTRYKAIFGYDSGISEGVELSIGRNIDDVFDYGNKLFINEENTIPDASTSAIWMSDIQNEETTKWDIYLKYNNKAYKVVAGYDSGITESVELIYVPQGREGKTVGYDSDLDGETEEWVIITDRNGLVEIVSKDLIRDEEGYAYTLTLGSEDTSVTVTTDLDGDGTIGDEEDIAIASYNNAITRINNYCDELVTATNNGGVRSVGGTKNEFVPYHSENYDNWGSTIKTEVASGDMQYEEDFVKLKFWGLTEELMGVYFFASRCVDLWNESTIHFDVYVINNYGYLLHYDLWSLYKESGPRSGGRSWSVRPVVINPEGI